MTWPDGGSTPFRGEKATNWEGGYRVPTLIRWPGVIKPGTVYNQFFAHEDFLPTLAAAAGDADVVARSMKTCRLGNKSFHVHLDGYNLIPFFKGEEKGFNKLHIPKIFNVRADPFERGDSSFLFDDWMAHRAFLVVPAQAVVAAWLKSFKDFPIRQKPASFNLDEVVQKLMPPE
jgi:arylsulfatase